MVYLECRCELLVEAFNFGLGRVCCGEIANDYFFPEESKIFLDAGCMFFDFIVLLVFEPGGFVVRDTFRKGLTKLW